MSTHADWPLELFWLDGKRGELFGVYFPPKVACRGAILALPPFTEELNRCRNMTAIQARAFAAAGYGCLIFDLYGTGESEGDFEDAHWNDWLDDCKVASDWLAERTNSAVTLWGIRMGALLAAQLAGDAPVRYKHLVLWQPVIDGKNMITQFLRIRVANLMDSHFPSETTKDMRRHMQEGKHIEVSGYLLPPSLGLELDQTKLSNFKNLQACRIDWLESVGEHGNPLSIASQKTIASLEASNIVVNAQGFSGPAFWELWNRAWAPELVEKTCALFA